MSPARRKCSRCSASKPVEDFNARRTTCRVCEKAERREKLERDPRKQLLESARRRAAARGLALNLTLDDLPPPPWRCQYLGDRLVVGRRVGERKVAPTLHRRQPSRGYVVGNVEIVSALANRMLSNATPAEARRFAKAILKKRRA